MTKQIYLVQLVFVKDFDRQTLWATISATSENEAIKNAVSRERIRDYILDKYTLVITKAEILSPLHCPHNNQDFIVQLYQENEGINGIYFNFKNIKDSDNELIEDLKSVFKKHNRVVINLLSS
jgi:phosphotransacetylase